MLIKDVKADLLQDHRNRYRDHCNGISQSGRDIRLNSEYSLDKWEFIAKEQGGQGGGQCMEY